MFQLILQIPAVADLLDEYGEFDSSSRNDDIDDYDDMHTNLQITYDKNPFQTSHSNYSTEYRKTAAHFPRPATAHRPALSRS